MPSYFRKGMHEKAVETEKKALEVVPANQRAQFKKRLEEFEAALKEKKG